jgi:hypothetical protein
MIILITTFALLWFGINDSLLGDNSFDPDSAETHLSVAMGTKDSISAEVNRPITRFSNLGASWNRYKETSGSNQIRAASRFLIFKHSFPLESSSISLRPYLANGILERSIDSDGGDQPTIITRRHSYASLQGGVELVIPIESRRYPVIDGSFSFRYQNQLYSHSLFAPSSRLDDFSELAMKYAKPQSSLFMIPTEFSLFGAVNFQRDRILTHQNSLTTSRANIMIGIEILLR